jgi:hypothetical protein
MGGDNLEALDLQGRAVELREARSHMKAASTVAN